MSWSKHLWQAKTTASPGLESALTCEYRSWSLYSTIVAAKAFALPEAARQTVTFTEPKASYHRTKQAQICCRPQHLKLADNKACERMREGDLGFWLLQSQWTRCSTYLALAIDCHGNRQMLESALRCVEDLWNEMRCSLPDSKKPPSHLVKKLNPWQLPPWIYAT